jgi:hypothetical protein
MEERKWLSSCQTLINPSALVGYVAKNRFLCVSVICGKASFPDQRIDFETTSGSEVRVSFSAQVEGFREIWSLFRLLHSSESPPEGL